jgi:hypothetical protein
MIFGGDKQSNSTASAESSAVVSSTDKMEHPTAAIEGTLSKTSKPDGSDTSSFSGDTSATNASNEAASSTTDTEISNRVETATSSEERQGQPECSEGDAHPNGAHFSKCGDKGAVRNELY